MTVQEILRYKGTHVVTTPPSTTLREAAQLLTERRVGAVPVLDGALVVGVFSEPDLVAAVAEHGAGALGLPVSAARSREVTACRPDSSLKDVMAVMTTQRIRHLPVLDGGLLAGIVSIGDIVKHRLREVETEAGVLRDYISVTRTSAQAR